MLTKQINTFKLFIFIFYRFQFLSFCESICFIYENTRLRQYHKAFMKLRYFVVHKWADWKSSQINRIVKIFYGIDLIWNILK
jgi:hypothetical protein